MRRDAAPFFPCRMPGSLTAVPPGAGAIEPIPAPGWEPALADRAAFHDDLDVGIPHRRAVEIGCFDGRREFVTEFHRRIRGLDFHFVFRLAVFLHAQANERGNPLADPENRAPVPEHRVPGNDDFALHRAERVSLEVLELQHFLATTVGEDERAGLVRVGVFVRLEVTDVAQIELQVRRVAGFVKRTI